MQGTVLYGPRDIVSKIGRNPRSSHPTDAIIRLSATCICGSDLWPYRGIQPTMNQPQWVTSTAASWKRSGKRSGTISRGQFVVGSFATLRQHLRICQDGYQSSCVPTASYERRAGTTTCVFHLRTARWWQPRASSKDNPSLLATSTF